MITQNEFGIQDQIETEVPNIEEEKKSYNAFILKRKGRLSKADKEVIKNRFHPKWDEENFAYSFHMDQKVLVEAYLKANKIEYTSLDDIYDPYHNLSDKEQKIYRLDQAKTIKTKEALENIMVLNLCLEDYNALYGTSLKKKDLMENSLESLLVGVDEGKQSAHLEILYSLAEKAKTKKEDVTQINQKIADTKESELDLPFEVIGHNSKRQVLIWSNKRIISLPVNQLTENELRLLVGGSSAWIIQNDWNKKLKNRIIDEAHDKGFVNDEMTLKSGIWKMKDKWVIISGKRLATFKNGVFTELDTPLIDGRLIELDGPAWLDWDLLKSLFEDQDKGFRIFKETFNEIRKKVKFWNWSHDSMADFITAFIMLSPLQHAMSWRPWVYLSGSKSTGKTTFFELMLQSNFGPLCERLDKSTAHATAQTIGNSGRIPIFDEFEKHKHIPDILETAKLFNRGGVKTSGTTGDKANKFELHHMGWFGSIYLPRRLIQDAAQESRMIKFELNKIKEGAPVPETIGHKEAIKLASKIAAGMILSWEMIQSSADEISTNRSELIKGQEGIEIRTVENFMYASSVIQLADPDPSFPIIPGWASRQLEDDCDKILDTILSSLIKIDYDSFSILEMLHKAYKSLDDRFQKELERKGIKITSTSGAKYLAIRCEDVTRFILQDTEYKDLNIQHPLARIDGSIASYGVKMAGRTKRCVLIPIDRIDLEL